MPKIGLYFHVPFCTRKCDYCHFYVLPDKQTFKDLLMEGIELEWRSIQPFLNHQEISTVYFGGGTPYLLGPKNIEEILNRISAHTSLDNLEITLEANPENIDRVSLKEYHALGINRLSIGVQSLDDHQLNLLSRLHSPQKSIDAVETAHAVGFENISIDLMYDLPEQKVISWKRTVERAIELPITHLSLYNLTIEPHTAFFKYRKKLEEQLPHEEESRAMYELACSSFESNNLKQYEISAFAKDGYKAQHNSGYWTGRPFLGLGPSAFSYWEGRRFRNVANLSQYVKALQKDLSPIDFSEQLPQEAHQRELLAIALRVLEGVNLSAFELEHGLLSETCHQNLKDLISEGYLEICESHLKLTHKGILFYDSVATDII